jgi:hypothetical protein
LEPDSFCPFFSKFIQPEGDEMTDQPFIDAALIEIHRIIQNATEEALHLDKSSVTYPPNGGLTLNELKALQELSLNTFTKLGLKKVIANACATSFFHFFCLLDGVGDPEITHFDLWPGISLVVKPEDDNEVMLHDEFYESYWKFRELKE